MKKIIVYILFATLNTLAFQNCDQAFKPVSDNSGMNNNSSNQTPNDSDLIEIDVDENNNDNTSVINLPITVACTNVGGDGPGVKTLREGTSNYSTCVSSSCLSSYTLISGACYTKTKSCVPENGSSGVQHRTGVDSFNDMCEAITCNNNYHLTSTKKCEADLANQISCTAVGGASPGIKTLIEGTSNYGACVLSSCISTHTLINGACYTKTKSCVPENGTSGVQYRTGVDSFNNKCEATNCNSKYHLTSTKTCEANLRVVGDEILFTFNPANSSKDLRVIIIINVPVLNIGVTTERMQRFPIESEEKISVGPAAQRTVSFSLSGTKAYLEAQFDPGPYTSKTGSIQYSKGTFEIISHDLVCESTPLDDMNDIPDFLGGNCLFGSLGTRQVFTSLLPLDDLF